MTKILLLWIGLLPLLANAQDYNKVDSRVLAYPQFHSLEQLGIRIQNDFREDEERVRAAFIWLTHNLAYGKGKEELFKAYEHITYNSEEGRIAQINALVRQKIARAFRQRKGVCIDFSLMLNALCEQFGLTSRVITGVAKTEITDTAGEAYFKNHTWNAVFLKGAWRLMDPTWASGHVDLVSKRFIRRYLDHYFFTPPEEFIRHHLPARSEWQLLEEKVEAKTFFAAPIYLPGFFGKGISLSPETKGILTVSRDAENYIHFDSLPEERLLYYTINGSGDFKKLGIRRRGENTYTSRIRIRRKFKRQYDYLTVYLDDQAILNFKLQDDQ